MRRALGRIAVAVSEEQARGCEEKTRAVPSLIADIAGIIRSEILPLDGSPTRGATVAAPVFAFLRRTAEAERTAEAATPRDPFGQPRADIPPRPKGRIHEALLWLEGVNAQKAFLHVGAPYARRWLRQLLEWAQTNPQAKPPRLPEGDPLAPMPEQEASQRSGTKRGRPKGSTALSTRTHALALLVLYLVEAEGLSQKTATRRVCNWAARGSGVRPDTDGLRRVRKKLKPQRVTAENLASLAPATVERYLLPPRVLGHAAAASHPRGRLLHRYVQRYAVAALMRQLVMPDKNSHRLRSRPRS